MAPIVEQREHCAAGEYQRAHLDTVGETRKPALHDDEAA
jgi:hypothetical protein